MRIKAAPSEAHKRTDGVPGRLVSEEDAGDLLFTQRVSKSPYDPLLVKLRAETPPIGPQPLLEFGNLRARLPVRMRAKKLGIPLEFAEREGRLYVPCRARQTARRSRMARTPI